MRPSLLERSSPFSTALTGGLLAVVGSVVVSHLCIWATGFQPSSWPFITTMMILCPAVIAPPMFYYYGSALHEIARQRRELGDAHARLEAAFREVRELRGLIPVCAWCHKVRDDEGYWNRVDSFLEQHTRVQVTHSICPDCQSREISAFTKKR